MNKAVFCLAKNEASADRIVSHLQTAGFDTEAISILFSDSKGLHQTTISTADMPRTAEGRGLHTRTTTDVPARGVKKGGIGVEKNTKIPEGATTGAISGG